MALFIHAFKDLYEGKENKDFPRGELVSKTTVAFL